MCKSIIVESINPKIVISRAQQLNMLLAKLSPCLDYLGLVKVMRTPYDDKSLLETWL